MTNSELGRRLGISHSMASRIRNGKRLPSVAVIVALNAELDIPVDELMRAHGEGPEAFGLLVRAALDGEPAPA